MSASLSLILQALGILGTDGLLDGVKLVVAGFALLLLAISLTAYRRNKSTRLMFVSGAFSVFLARVLVVENLSLLFPSISLDIVDLLRGSLDLLTLLLFFLAVVRS
ncbi:MAG: hypothetical protein JRM80_09690 [Nitrososphaerota archaeon]|nr:hypothetical protein [Nitrososphaerota archaeon]